MPTRTAIFARLPFAAAALAAFTGFGALPAQAAETGSADARRIEELEQRLLILERKLELQAEDASSKAKDAPTVTAGEKGFGLKKGDYELKFNALAQVDGRFFLDDAHSLRDTFLLRRLRPTLQGSLGKLVGFRFTPEFAGANGQGDGGATSAIVDAYLDLKFSPRGSLRIGKQKGPLGLERLQSGGSIELVERGLVTELVPNRDLGVALFGEAFDGTLSYTLGAFNGTADGRDVSTADDGLKEFEGRVFAEPFKNDYGFFKSLGFGIAGSSGAKDGGGNNLLPRYRTPGQNQFFAYESTVLADGQHERIVPQFYLYKGPLGLLGEYAKSSQVLRRGSLRKRLHNQAYALTASYALTGEDANYRGLKPASPFSLGAPGWGALEVVARIGALDVDNDAFSGTAATRFADSASSASEAQNLGLGVNWVLNQNAKLSADFNRTRFEGGAAAGSDRRTEQALFTRLTVQY